jgi:hypothetical protein
MLFNINDVEMRHVPHQQEYAEWMAQLSNVDHDAVVSAINAYIDPRDWFVSSFIPGQDWTGTVYAPLYAACRQSKKHSGWFFGLICWQTVIYRTDSWYFDEADSSFDGILGKKYWRKK